MSTLGGARLVKVVLQVPPSGGWYADVTLETGGLPALGLTTLVVGNDLALVGTVTLTDTDAPDQPRAIVEGGAGWRTLIPIAGSYASTTGVRLSTVLRDLAKLAQEPYDAPTDATLPDAYGWDASAPLVPVRCRAVLGELVTRGAIPTWRVAPTGRTRFDAWPALPAADATCRVISRSLGRGVRYLGLDTRAAGLLPGSTIEGVTIARTVYRQDSTALTCEAWTS